MSKAVLISIQPKYCNLVVNGKKTIEVRKTMPKLQMPFKCYIYCTYGLGLINPKDEIHPNLLLSQKVSVNKKWDNCCNGKVIGEFLCYDIYEYETEFYPEEKHPVFEAVYEYNEEQEVWECVLSNNDEHETIFAKKTCLSLENFRNYLGVGENRFYGWRISNLIIYDKPKELSKLCYFCDSRLSEKCYGCKYLDSDDLGREACDRRVFKAPQSWCYVEELSGA